jgi:ABC-type multidrug transport system ATPase subunit/pSer/pThr/pTyr-binding forkhead associated (FHA) protein/ABC-type multidrug transport system permease subunit
MLLRIPAPDGSTCERVITVAIVRLGRDPASEVAFDQDAYPMVSGRHARLERTAHGCVLTPLSQSNQTLLNDHPVEGPLPVKAGDRIRLGFTGPTVEIVALPPLAPTPPGDAKPAPAEAPGATVLAAPQHLVLLRGSFGAERVPIGRGGVIGRGPGQVEFVLDHPHVSRRHARLTVAGGRVLLHDLGSANGTFVNGRRLTRPVELRSGYHIDIGPFSLEFDGDALVGRSRSNNIELVARKLKRVVEDRTTGRPLTLLDDVSLVVHPREFVCVLGPSGSGKTTLLGILSGRRPPDAGAVRVNGRDLHADFAALKQDLALVPQKDVLHNALALGAALRYTAELRLPPDTGRAELDASVADILAVVGLTHRRDTLLRHLSGGELKRASLANELMARPSLLFLDEVTSGLDEQTDRELMELFRQVADGGKTVVCVTHSLANVEATCHLVVLLTPGGRLAFVGTPQEAQAYFRIDRLGDVYRKLAERPAADWQAAFRANPLHARYVRDRLPGWLVEGEVEGGVARAEGWTRVNPLRQAWTLTRRYVAIWRGDPMAMLAMLGQALLVALLLGAVFGRLEHVANPLERAQRTINLLFLLAVACFWFGCNNAAKEVVKERVIYARERDFNLRFDSYWASKYAVLALIALLQASLLFGIVRLWCDPPGPAPGQWAVLAALGVAGTGLGLLLSAAAKTEEVAVALVPVAVLPQIILAGVIAPLSGWPEWLADGVITVRWGAQALESLLPDDHLRVLRMDCSAYGNQIAVIGAHAAVFAGLTLFTLWWQGRGKGKG